MVNPDEVVDEYGADAVRLYEMFMGPLDATKPWQTSGVAGVWRFLNRSWRIVCNSEDELDADRIVDTEPSFEFLVLLHKTIAAVGQDIERLRFNTAIAKLMELVNALTALDERPRQMVETFVLLLSPFSPHIAEEMWQKLGHEKTLAYEPWPKADEKLVQAEADLQEYPIQINGKLRARVNAAPGLENEELLAVVKAAPNVQTLLANVTIVKEVVVPGRLVNFVVTG